MLTNSSNSDRESATLDRAARIRAVIAEEHEALLRSVAVLVAKTEPRLRWPEVMEKASEILHEAVQVSLQHALAFDPSRSATAWVRGIAARLLLNRRRAEARGRRCVSATVLGEAAWVAALGQLCAGSSRRGGRRTARLGAGDRAHFPGEAARHRMPLLPGAGRERSGERPGGYHGRGRTRAGVPGAAGSAGSVSPRRGRGPSMNDAPKPSAPGPRGVALPGRPGCG